MMEEEAAEGKRRRPRALVTGSSNGIGEAIVKQLARLDYELVVTGRQAADIARVAAQCQALSPSKLKPREIVAELESEQEVERLFHEAVQVSFGGELELLVNNAGFGWPVSHELADECYASFKRIMQINLNAAVRLSLLAAPALKAAAGRQAAASSLVFVGSIAGERPSSALAAYSSSKAALNMFASCMSVELAPLVRVNCVSPGPIETKIIERSGFTLDQFRRAAGALAPLGRVGLPDEVAQCVLFLADPKRASYVTGANLRVDGGTQLAPLSWQP